RQRLELLCVLARRPTAGDRWRRPGGSIVGWPHRQGYQPAPAPFTRASKNKLQPRWRAPGDRLFGWYYPGLVGAGGPASPWALAPQRHLLGGPLQPGQSGAGLGVLGQPGPTLGCADWPAIAAAVPA